MTMFSSENRRQLLYHGGGGGGYGVEEGFGVMNQLGYGLSSSEGYCIGGGSDLVFGPLVMAEEDSRTQSLNESSSKDCERDDDAWLQLSIGAGGAGAGRDVSSDRKNCNLVELELMPNNNNNSNDNNNNDINCISHSQIRPLLAEFQAPRPMNLAGGFPPPTAFFLHPQGGSGSSNFHPNQEINNWALIRPTAMNMNMIPISIASSSSSSFSSMASASYFPRPFQLDMAPPTPLPGADFRVIQAPRRPHSGIWFMLQASQNQDKEPFLPQISKSYLRIKDGKMTIRLVMKYLVNKLRLENESEIEIQCKGQRLQPSLTLQHVRDNIWSNAPRDFISVLPNSSTAHHIMVLHYARTTFSI